MLSRLDREKVEYAFIEGKHYRLDDIKMGWHPPQLDSYYRELAKEVGYDQDEFLKGVREANRISK